MSVSNNKSNHQSSAPFMAPDLRSPRNLACPLQNDPVYTMPRINHGLTQLAPVLPLQVLTSALSRSFVWKDKTKYWKRWYGGKLRQTMVESWYSPDRVVPEGMSQVSGQSEVRNHKRRTLDTRLSSGTSAGTFAVSAGPYIITVPKQVRKTLLTCFLYSFKKRGGKSVLTFRTQDLVDFFLERFRSTLKTSHFLHKLVGFWTFFFHELVWIFPLPLPARASEHAGHVLLNVVSKFSVSNY